MSREGLSLESDDGSGRYRDWQQWNLSVDGMAESLLEQARNGGAIGRAGLRGTIERPAFGPLHDMADLEARLRLGQLGIG